MLAQHPSTRYPTLVIHGQHGARASEELARRLLYCGSLSDRASSGLVERSLNRLFDLTNVERLTDVIECPRPDRFDGRLQRAESAHEQNLTLWVHTFERT